MSEWVLFYDGGCNLCHTSRLRVENWAERARQPLRATPIQSDEGMERGYPVTEMVLEIEGRVFRGADAWLELMRVAPWYLSWVHKVRGFPPLRALLKWGYRFVAKHRIRWFGSRECKLPATHKTS